MDSSGFLDIIIYMHLYSGPLMAVEYLASMSQTSDEFLLSLSKQWYSGCSSTKSFYLSLHFEYEGRLEQSYQFEM